MQHKNILSVQSSARYQDSITRQVSQNLTAQLALAYETKVIERDLGEGLPFISESWINANFTDQEQRDNGQKQQLSQSDSLVQELINADIVVIGSPIYNFSVPAVLKAWVDLVARARVTFRYTDNGPEGLLKNKKAYVVMASGGVPISSELDFATVYLKHVMGFIGIDNVTVIDTNKETELRIDTTGEIRDD